MPSVTFKTEKRPSALQVEFNNIPGPFRNGSRCVLWRYELRDEKWTKVPYQTNGRRASSTDPQTWGSFKSVRRAYRTGGWDGVGFVLSEDDDLVGVDLDHCRDPQTGVVEAWAQEIIDTLDSYTELSPSRTGVHVFVRAAFHSPKNREGRIEIYSTGRYLTVTGHAL